MSALFITLHLDACGGEAAEESVDVKVGGSYGLLPGAHRDGYIFAGWFTSPEGGEQKISSDPLISDEDHTLYAHWIVKKKERFTKYTRSKLQKRALIVLAASIVCLSVILGVVSYVVNLRYFTDADGTKYRIKQKDGIYVLCDTDGYTLDKTTDGYFITDAGNLIEVDETSGDASVYAVVDTEGNEAVGTSNRILMFPHTAKAAIASIEVHNSYGTYTFYRDKDNNFQIKEHEGISYDKELLSALVVSTGYTLSMEKLKDPIKDENGAFTEYGLAPEVRVDEDGNEYNYEPAYYILTDVSGNKYEVIIGDPIVSGAGYYAQYRGRDAVYILSNDLSKTLLVPIENLVTPMIVYPMTMTTYFDVDNFTLIRYDYEGAAAAGLDFSKEDLTDEELAALEPYTKVLTSFRYIDLEERQNTENSSIPYLMTPLSDLDSYNANSINIDTCLQAFLNMSFVRVVKLGITEKILAEYGLDMPRYVIYMKFQNLEHYIYISDMTEDGTYYIGSPLFDQMVEVDRAYLPFLHWNEFDWVDPNLLQVNLAFVDYMQLTSPTYNVTFRMDNSASDQSKNVSSEKIVVTADVGSNSRQPVVTDVFRQFYKTVLYASMEGVCDLDEEQMAALRAKPDSEAELVMTIKLLSGKELVYRFYRYTERKCFMTINGQGVFYILNDRVVKFITDAEKAVNGQEIDAVSKN